MDSTSDPNAERKRILRAEMRARRRRLADRRREASLAVADRAAPLIAPVSGRVVAGYVALADEIDPLPLMRRLAESGARLALPVVETPDAPLVFRRWRPGDPLRRGAFGIDRPDDAAPVVRPEWLLVPLLAFDRRGHRLGFGGGYYDRTLARLRADGCAVRAVGLAFAAQELDSLPVAAYDVPLDLVVTERAVIRPARDDDPAGRTD